MTARSAESAARNARILAELHAGPRLLVLPNAWDASSARVLEAAGFAAIATTSAGVARSLGFEDHQAAPPGEMLAAAARIVGAVSVPVTVDFESGYAFAPREIAERLIEIGAAGLNFEDTDHAHPGALLDATLQSERIAALKESARAAGVDLVVNARVDVFVQKLGTPVQQAEEGLRRARLYRSAGADCIYPILATDEAVLAEFVQAVGTININVRPGGPLSLQRSTELGIRRVSYAGSLFRELISALERSAAQIRAEADVAASTPTH